MKRKSQSKAAVTRRNFSAGLGAAGIVAGVTPFNIVRAQGAALKVGVLLPRSGVQAGIGQDCQRGVDITNGLLKELGMPTLEIINADTETKVEVARSRAEKLISDGAQLLVGAFDSGQTIAIAQVAGQKAARETTSTTCPSMSSQKPSATMKQPPAATVAQHEPSMMRRPPMRSVYAPPARLSGTWAKTGAANNAPIWAFDSPWE